MNIRRTTIKLIKRLFCLFWGCIILFSASTLKAQENLKILHNSYEKLEVEFKNSELKARYVYTPEGIFYEISVEGFGYSVKAGFPKLPVLKKLIEIPVNAQPKVSILSYTTREVHLSELLGLSDLLPSRRIIPAQPPISKSLRYEDIPFVYKKKVYEKDEFIGQELVSVENIGFHRAEQLGRLEIAPFRYNPKQEKLIIYENIHFEIVFEGADVAQTIERKQKYYSPYFLASTKRILNYHPVAMDKANITRYPVKYVIVSDPMFQAALQPFVQWKTKKGFTVVEAYTNNPSVGNTTTSIKNYLKGLYDNATPSDPAPSFVLLVGDVQQIPAFSGTTGSHVTDLYYCEYTGDKLPEAYYGRFSATNISELQPQIDKTLEYEQFQMPDPSFLGECVMIAGVDANFAQVHGNGQINYGTTEYFNSNFGLTSHTYLYPASGNSASQIIQNISNGVGYANYTAHGTEDGWSDPAFPTSQIATLQNAHKYPLMVGNCCLTNTFNQAVCFGEALLRAANKGALGYIGGSNTTTWDEDYWWAVGYRANVVQNPTYSPTQLGAYDRTFHSHNEPFAEHFTTQGQMVSAGNLAVEQSGSSKKNYYWEVYHLMGDPSLSVYFGVPPQLNVSYNPIVPLGSTSFTINTEPYAYCAFSMNGILYGAALADSTGLAELSLNPLTIPGVADIVITKQNRQPYFGTVIVQTPSGPYVLYQSNSLNDAAGNNNGRADYGESIKLNVALANVGVADAQSVSAKLSSNCPFITITDSLADWGTINPNDTVMLNDAFAFTVSQFVADQTNAQFNLVVNEGTPNEWNYQFNIKLNAPLLNVQNLLIKDSIGGNNNGRLDAGETAELFIGNINAGHASISNVIGQLSCTSNYITINSSSYNVGTLSENGSSLVNAVFNITVAPAVPIGTPVSFTYNAASGQYEASKTFNTKIGIIGEDWESGDFSSYNWVNSTSAPWVVTDSIAYEGSYCVRSGVIGNSASSVLQITMNVAFSDTIYFFRKVSSEANYDFLEFAINNVKKDSWSGEQDWALVSYPVTAGNRTFKWTYKKDYYQVEGFDMAWIDNIVFPTIATSVRENIARLKEMAILPNPAKDFIDVVFNLSESSDVVVRIINSLGQEVARSTKKANAGNQSLRINVSDLNSGIYICTLETENQKITRKLIINQ